MVLNKKMIYKISLSNVLKEIYFIYKISFECNYIKWLETKKENDIILKFNCNNSAIKW